MLNQEEIWKDIQGYEGIYQVSTLGEIRSRYSGEYKLLHKTLSCGKYFFVTLCFNHKKDSLTVHRVVAKEFIFNPDNKPCVNHKNGIKTDNRVDNLEWVTYSENMKHCYKSKLRPITVGSKSPNGKLKDVDVKKIKQLIKEGVSLRKIGILFNTAQSNISCIKKNKTWKHIKEN